jgi:glycine betaine catabolism A
VTDRAPVPAAALDAVLDPAGSGTMLPAAAYLDEAVLAWERRHLFGAAWACAGRSADLVAPGARRAVTVGGASIVVVRGADGRLRGFHNVCRHRGSELLPCGATVARGPISCPYHAWVYEPDGRLRSTPRFRPPPGFDPADHGLVPVRAEEWHGWAMVDLSGSAPPLADHVGDLDGLVAPYRPGDLVEVAAHDYVLAANWKLPAENYHECYHCPSIHPELCRVSPPGSASNLAGRGLWIGGVMDLADGTATMSLDGRSGGEPLPGLGHRHLRTVLYVQLFPNLLLSLHPDYVLTHRIEPLAAGSTAIECRWLVQPDVAARPGFDPAWAVDFWDVTNRQDWSACEGVQRGVASAAYRPGPLSAGEDAVAGFVRLVAAAYRDGRLPSPAGASR